MGQYQRHRTRRIVENLEQFAVIERPVDASLGAIERGDEKRFALGQMTAMGHDPHRASLSHAYRGEPDMGQQRAKPLGIAGQIAVLRAQAEMVGGFN